MRRFLLCLPVIMSLSTPALADPLSKEAPEEAVDRIVLGVGTFNWDDDDNSQRSSDFRAEAHFESYPVWKLHPWAGLEVLQKGMFWLGGGLETDINLYKNLAYLTLQTGIGYFKDDVQEYSWRAINPPEGIAFRHQIELSYRFPTGNRIGLGYSHMSNAGIYDRNPGKDSLTINFHIPFTWTPGRTSQPAR